jgi:GNAT superfamily N-acetyltransferase
VNGMEKGKNNTKKIQDHFEIAQLALEYFSTGCEIISRYLPDQIDTYRRYYQKYSAYYLGCFLNGKLVGLCFGLPLWEMDPEQDEHFLLDGIALCEEYRNLGYGTKLLKEWEKQAFSHQPLKKICLGTTGVNARRFYDCNGYTPYGYLAFKDKEGFDEAVYTGHLFYRRCRVCGGTVLLYFNGVSYNEHEEQTFKGELNLVDVVVLYEKIAP